MYSDAVNVKKTSTGDRESQAEQIPVLIRFCHFHLYFSWYSSGKNQQGVLSL